MAIKNLGRVVGLSAYETWLAQGNDGTEEDFLATLKGEKGDTGEIGPQGPQGEQGPEGRGAQADWSQNDENADSYIKNRPFYEGVTTDEIVILEKKDRDFPLTNDEMMFYTYTFTEEEKSIMNSLTSGTLKLTVNSEYSKEKYIADIQQSVVANGPEIFNVTLGDGNIARFRLMGDNLFITSADETRYNIELVCITETSSIVKIPEKYLPDTIATKEYVDEVFNSIVNGDEVSY